MNSYLHVSQVRPLFWQLQYMYDSAPCEISHPGTQVLKSKSEVGLSVDRKALLGQVMDKKGNKRPLNG